MKNELKVGQQQRPYIIEVNDKGEVITFDLADTRLGVRLLDMLAKIEQIDRKYARKAAELETVPDTPLKGTPFTKRQAESIRLVNDFYTDARKAVDLFFGEGACQKIFGAANTPRMFTDLMVALTPHFEKMGLEVTHLKADIAKRYLPDPAQTSVLR